jgi:short-subunit dehydrogenase
LRQLSSKVAVATGGGSSPVRVSVVYPGATHTRVLANSPVLHADERERPQANLDKFWGQDPSHVGNRIVDGIPCDRARVLVGVDAELTDLLVRALPAAHSRLVRRPVDLMTGRVFLDSVDSRRRNS